MAPTLPGSKLPLSERHDSELLVSELPVSVIIPAINEAELISRAVTSAIHPACEVIVVDGGSQDDTPNRVTAAGARLIHSTPGRARQQNAGAAQAVGNVLLFLHADNWLAPGTVDQLITQFQNPGVVWGACRQRIDSPRWIYRAIECGNRWRLSWQRLAYGDQAVCVRRKIFQQVGGFQDVPLLEDVLLSQRLARLARPTLLRGTVHVHPRRWQQNGPIRQTWRNWWLMLQFRCGRSPDSLAQAYRRHDR